MKQDLKITGLYKTRVLRLTEMEGSEPEAERAGFLAFGFVPFSTRVLPRGLRWLPELQPSYLPQLQKVRRNESQGPSF